MIHLTKFPTLCKLSSSAFRRWWLIFFDGVLLLIIFVGTFYNLTGLQNVSGCLPCTAGYYCDGTGNIVPTKKCREGFWCRGGSPEEMPIDQPYGTDCPNGSYCPTGTPSPVQCPKGTYQPSRGKVRVEDCVGCDPGKFCDETGLFAVSGNCLRGFFCVGNASKSNPEDKITGDICPKGSFCVEGSFKPQTCYNGTYMNHTGLLLHWCQLKDITPHYLSEISDTFS